MKPLSLTTEARSISLVFVTVSSLLFASFFLSAGWRTAEMQARLSLGDVITGLRTSRVRGEFVPLVRRNEILADGVNRLGVSFILTPEIESELRAEGATETLINAIRQKGPKPSPTATPTLTP